MSQVNRGYVDDDEKGGSVTLVRVKKIGVEWEEKMSNRLSFAVVLVFNTACFARVCVGTGKKHGLTRETG